MGCSGCNQQPARIEKSGDYYMAERILVPLPISEHMTRLELFHGDPDTPERSSQQWPGTESIKMKLPDHVPVEDCLIVIKVIDDAGEEVGNPYQFKDGRLMPFNPETDRWQPRTDPNPPAPETLVEQQPAPESSIEAKQDVGVALIKAADREEDFESLGKQVGQQLKRELRRTPLDDRVANHKELVEEEPVEEEPVEEEPVEEEPVEEEPVEEEPVEEEPVVWTTEEVEDGEVRVPRQDNPAETLPIEVGPRYGLRELPIEVKDDEADMEMPEGLQASEE